jgi:hypothetical protein
MKNILKKLLAKTNSKLEYPVVVASCGRSCSTLLTMAIAESASKIKANLGGYSLKHGIVMYEWRLKKANFVDGMVYKTHDLPPVETDEVRKVKFIYTYSDPYKIISSPVKKERELGKKWIKDHSWRLRGEAKSMENAFREDVIGFKKNFELWRKKENIDILLLRANEIWKQKDKIEDHIGITVSLPERRERTSDIKEIDSEEKIEEMKKTYGDMHEVVQKHEYLDKRR